MHFLVGLPWVLPSPWDAGWKRGAFGSWPLKIRMPRSRRIYLLAHSHNWVKFHPCTLSGYKALLREGLTS